MLPYLTAVEQICSVNYLTSVLTFDHVCTADLTEEGTDALYIKIRFLDTKDTL